MTLSMQDLDYVLELSHLEITPQAKEQYLLQLQSILGHMEALNKLDLDATQPTYYGDVEASSYREDEVVPQENLLLEENAPRWENGCFQVPKIGA